MAAYRKKRRSPKRGRRWKRPRYLRSSREITRPARSCGDRAQPVRPAPSRTAIRPRGSEHPWSVSVSVPRLPPSSIAKVEKSANLSAANRLSRRDEKPHSDDKEGVVLSSKKVVLSSESLVAEPAVTGPATTPAHFKHYRCQHRETSESRLFAGLVARRIGVQRGSIVSTLRQASARPARGPCPACSQSPRTGLSEPLNK